MGLRRLLLDAVLLLPFLALATPAAQPEAHYLGSKVCAQCHKSIAATQSQSAMANTWQTGRTTWLTPNFRADVEEGPGQSLLSFVRRVADQFHYSVRLPGHDAKDAPVEAMVGGRRHGLGFLTRISEVDGASLARPVLLQARYAYSMSEKRLMLAPGCPEAKPQNYKTAFGLPLSPEYERRCLECHGKPNTLGAGVEGGVQCESCHGPGSAHLQAVAKGNARSHIVNPKRLNAEESIAVCAQCHIGLTKYSDPAPVDLLVANQVVALKSSECFLQSRQGITCSTCHNAHEDAPASAAGSVKACLQCHAAEASPHAAICPVNAKSDCIGCHMPTVEIGPFHLVDHWIRVHPEQHVPAPADMTGGKSQFTVVSEFLEKQQMTSLDGPKTVAYLGRENVDALGPELASVAARLAYGETSAPVPVAGHYVALRRMPRDFKSDAAALEDSAELRFASGDWNGALAQSREALSIYPRCLRATVTIGRVLSERGAFIQATDILQQANRFYPDDANAAYHLARVLGKLGRSSEAIANYRRAIAADPDFTSAYLNLGKALVTGGDVRAAIEVFRQGLRIDPLNPALYRDLSMALAKQGDAQDSAKALQTALRIEAGSVPAQ